MRQGNISYVFQKGKISFFYVCISQAAMSNKLQLKVLTKDFVSWNTLSFGCIFCILILFAYYTLWVTMEHSIGLANLIGLSKKLK